MKTVRLLPPPGVPIGYIGGKPVYPMLGASPDDDSEIEVEQDDEPDDAEEEEPDDDQAEDGKYTAPSRGEWLKVQNALVKANASAKQRREALAEKDKLIKELQDEKAKREAADERRQLIEDQRQGAKKKGKTGGGGGGAAPAPTLPDSVLTKAQVRQAVAEAAREAEERTAARYQNKVAKAAAKAALIDAGAPKSGVSRLVGMLNLEDVEIDEDGEVSGGLEDQVESLKEELPQLFAAVEPVKPVRKRTAATKVAAAGRQEAETRPLSTAERMAQQVLGSRV